MDSPEIVVTVNTSVFALFSFSTTRIFTMTDTVVIYADDFAQAFMDCFVTLAMTDAVVFADRILPQSSISCTKFFRSDERVIVVGTIVVRAKNFSLSRRLGCGDKKSRRALRDLLIAVVCLMVKHASP
jgi:hypothetical protein